jgi:hypothetical protein
LPFSILYKTIISTFPGIRLDIKLPIIASISISKYTNILLELPCKHKDDRIHFPVLPFLVNVMPRFTIPAIIYIKTMFKPDKNGK